MAIVQIFVMDVMLPALLATDLLSLIALPAALEPWILLLEHALEIVELENTIPATSVIPVHLIVLPALLTLSVLSVNRF